MDWPTSLIPAACSVALKKISVQWRSPLNGNLQAVEIPGERWTMSLQLPARKLKNSGEAEALLAYLAGGQNQINVWHFARPVPRGTITGSPTVSGGASRGDQQMTLTTTTGYTLLAGDLFKAGGQLFQVRSDVTASAGSMTVLLVNRVRAAISNGAGVTLDTPKIAMVCTSDANAVTYRPGVQEGPAIDLEEVF
jgi:hypothetical protein